MPDGRGEIGVVVAICFGKYLSLPTNEISMPCLIRFEP